MALIGAEELDNLNLCCIPLAGSKRKRVQLALPVSHLLGWQEAQVNSKETAVRGARASARI
jgi:hypothetical protein